MAEMASLADISLEQGGIDEQNYGGLTLEPLVADHQLEAEESRKLVYKDGDFCLFYPQSVTEVESKDVMKLQENLSVVVSSVPSEEEVKLFQILLILRIKYWTLKSGCGVVTSFDTGLISDPAQVYTCLINLEYTKLVLCCLSKRPEGLELFIPELDKYSDKIQKYLHRKFSLNLDGISEDHEALKILQSWTKSISYLNNVVFNYQSYLSVLLHSSLVKPVKVSGDDSTSVFELQRLVEACSVEILTRQEEKQLIDFGDTDTDSVQVKVISSSQLDISSSEKTEFSDSWAKKLTDKGQEESDSFYLKSIIDKFKLKIIQDLNAVKRLVRDAKTDYYALYKCYSFLKSTGNIDIMLKSLRSDANHQTEETESLAVLSSLKEFHTRQTSSSSSSSDNLERNQTPQQLLL